MVLHFRHTRYSTIVQPLAKFLNHYTVNKVKSITVSEVETDHLPDYCVNNLMNTILTWASS